MKVIPKEILRKLHQTFRFFIIQHTASYNEGEACSAQVKWLMTEVGLYFSNHSQSGHFHALFLMVNKAARGAGQVQYREHHLFPSRLCTLCLYQPSSRRLLVITEHTKSSRNWALTVKQWWMEQHFNGHTSTRHHLHTDLSSLWMIELIFTINIIWVPHFKLWLY